MSELIALFGVIVSGIFSWLLFRSTKKNTLATEKSAEAAMASVEFSNELKKEKETIKRARHDQALNDLKLQAIEIIHVFMEIHSQVGELRGLNKLKFDPYLKKQASSYQHEYFEPSETKLIDESWQKLHIFMLNYPIFNLPNSQPPRFEYDANKCEKEVSEVLSKFDKIYKL